MANKHYKELIQFLEGPGGYTFDRVGSGGGVVYKNPRLSHHRLGIVRITQTIHDQDAKNFIHNISRELGIDTPRDGRKRKADQIKERRAAERAQIEADMERGRAELAELVAKKEADRTYRLEQLRRNRPFGGLELTTEEVDALEAKILEKQKQILDWQKALSMPFKTGQGNGWYHG